jgi:hypothetical protein
VQVLQVLDDHVDHAVALLQPATHEPDVAVPRDLVKPLPDRYRQDDPGWWLVPRGYCTERGQTTMASCVCVALGTVETP